MNQKNSLKSVNQIIQTVMKLFINLKDLTVKHIQNLEKMKGKSSNQKEKKNIAQLRKSSRSRLLTNKRGNINTKSLSLNKEYKKYKKKKNQPSKNIAEAIQLKQSIKKLNNKLKINNQINYQEKKQTLVHQIILPLKLQLAQQKERYQKKKKKIINVQESQQLKNIQSNCRRPSNPYMQFLISQRHHIQNLNADQTGKQKKDRIDQIWRKMSRQQKKIYEDMYVKTKQAYTLYCLENGIHPFKREKKLAKKEKKQNKQQNQNNKEKSQSKKRGRKKKKDKLQNNQSNNIIKIIQEDYTKKIKNEKNSQNHSVQKMQQVEKTIQINQLLNQKEDQKVINSNLEQSQVDK